ncbi:flavin reductase family protein [Saccharopolyspora phatthalungensis]|uniref:Flavin reductase (DIM6/NTAB) family NADH-FMN oxidoreductase RutF n=1 Tax=Saccharopolyspora phatthalungensis TaxID=664693 RepID=A0A840QK24_9PSEU|nr:flavin reductase family protein [Saccharopolyspora phatthalungensis]MBB5159669.1 flavin reductase (DIM6/NTAB) family NADH-FMN oxidoreductase RutF [Saccharopolyspora phatthalungensis]
MLLDRQNTHSGVDAATLRAVAGTFATGITIITCTTEHRPQGCAANAVLSVSLDPPLMLVSLAESSRTRAAIESSGTFAINVLPDNPEGTALCAEFASRSDDKFAQAAHHPGTLGAPVLRDALGWFECAVHSAFPAGDHTLFVGRVIAAGHAEGEPLVFFRGEKRRLTRKR